MKSAIATLSSYNQHANSMLYDILAVLDPVRLNETAGSYFGSIIGILNHMLIADFSWLARLRDRDVGSSSLSSPVLDFTNPGFGKILYEDFAELRSHQERVDSIFIDLAADLESASGPSGSDVVVFVSPKAETRRYRVGEILLQVLNHATHHRGNISQILDQWGVENDFSGIFPVLTPPPADD